MLLKHQYNGNLGGGGGSRLGPATITFGGISAHVAPLVGEMMILTIEAQYGVFGTQNQPTWGVSDDAGNVWVNVGNTFLPGIIAGFGDPHGAYVGAFDLSTWVCFAHNGSAITGITFTQTNTMTNGWDCQGGASLSIWDTSGYTASYYSKTFGSASMATATLDPFTPPATTELIIASFSAGVTISSDIQAGTYQPGWTGPLTTGIGLYVDDYKLAPTGSQTPTYTSPTSASYWLASAVAITAVPPTFKYQAAGGFTASAVEHKSDASVDNLEITHFLDSDIISEADLRAGLYDNAEVELRVISWAHPEYGSLKLLKGTLGQVSMKNGVAHTEFRGLTQKLTTNISATYGPGCRAELFDGKLTAGDPVSNPGSPWRCGKDPTGFTFTNAVGSSPDAITIIPSSPLTFPSLTGNVGTAVTLNGVAVTARFTTHGTAGGGGFDLEFGGTVGNPHRFGGGSAVSITETATGNSLNFNGGAEYSASDVAVISPINWAVIDNGGHVLSWAQPFPDAQENYDLMIDGQFYIPAAGHVTFQVAHDDGILWAVIPTVDHPTDVVTVVSGPVCPPLNQVTNQLNQTLTAYHGYSFGQYHDYVGATGDHGSGSHYVAADNRQGNRTTTWTLNFPAAGTYNFEFGFTNLAHRQQLQVTVVGQANDLLPNSLGSISNAVSGWYDNGLLRFTSGAMKDWTFDVQTVADVGSPVVKEIKLFAGNAMPFAPAPGDTFTIQTGCNHLTSDCFYKYGNVVNFQGEPQMPGNLVLIQTPDLH